MHLLLLLIGLCGAAVMQTAVAAPPLPGMVPCQATAIDVLSEAVVPFNAMQRDKPRMQHRASELSRSDDAQVTTYPGGSCGRRHRVTLLH